MVDSRILKLANLLVNYCAVVEEGDRVLINGAVGAFPLVQEVYRSVLKAGGHPFLLLQDDAISEIFLKEASKQQLEYVAEPLRLIFDSYECMITIEGTLNTRSLSAVDPLVQQKVQSARSELTETYIRRSAKGDLRWVVTRYPTHAYAQEADMSLSDYEDFVHSACFTDQADPVDHWLHLQARQEELIDWLAGKRRLQVKGPNIDMRLSIEGRTFVNADGRRNMPSGEIFTGPVEDSVDGWVHFTYPAIVNGREVDGVELTFEKGKVVSATAKKNEEYLHTMLDADDGARYLGEFAIGTNDGIQRFTKSILYDEKIGGTVHMAVGRGYPETGSQNISAIHWDMICDMRDGGKIWADDELFYVDGKFLI